MLQQHFRSLHKNNIFKHKKMDNTLFEKTDSYIASLLGNERKALQDATALNREHQLPDISISVNQGKFLQVLARACGAQRILELGTLGAYSSIWLGDALPDGGKLISLEANPLYYDIAMENIRNAGLASKVEIRLGKALDLLPEMQKEGMPPFDMIFIDADKPPYLEYMEWAIKLSRPGSLIIADNVIRNGRVLDEQSQDPAVTGAQRLNAFLKTCTAVSATILQTVGAKEHDGMVIAVVN
jgi:caffeoyl-CoA O-methyltransferase